METILPTMNIIIHPVFKSYYVVWKLMVKDERTEIIGFDGNMFKSYYVVWKQNMSKKIKETEEDV